MSVKQMCQLTQRAMRENPAQLSAFFKDLKRVMQRAKTSEDKAQAVEFLKRMKSAITPALWQKHGLEAELRVLVIAK
jgi:hypothetical protein